MTWQSLETLPDSSARFSTPTLCLMISMKHEGYVLWFPGFWFAPPSKPATLIFFKCDVRSSLYYHT